METAAMDDAENERPVPSIARFYFHNRPILRVIHGLREGADTIACDVFQEMAMPALEKDFAAVAPFPIADYRASSDPNFLPECDQQLAACSYVVVTDGIYDKPEESTTSPERLHLSNRRRARAYSCKFALVLRQSDILVAVVNPDLGGKLDGTPSSACSLLRVFSSILFRRSYLRDKLLVG